MSITRNAVPLILASTLLTGCAGLQKTDYQVFILTVRSAREGDLGSVHHLLNRGGGWCGGRRSGFGCLAACALYERSQRNDDK